MKAHITKEPADKRRTGKMTNFENITIEKGMYQQKGKTLTDVLETLDPSENYKGTTLSNLDAFSRQLKRFALR